MSVFTRSRAGLLALVVAMVVVGGCGKGDHPLDDSETRPPSAAAALAEADGTLDEMGETTLQSAAYTAGEWVPDDGCGTNAESPEQGDVGRILHRSYERLPAGSSPSSLIADQAAAWEDAGHRVGSGSPNMAEQTIARINGISYSLVDAPPGVELRAFLPCY